MGIRYNSPDSVLACRNKFLARERFRAAGLLVPEFHRVALADGPQLAAARRPLSVRTQAARTVGQPRRDPRQQSRRIRGRISPHRDACCAIPTSCASRDEQDHFLQVESFIEGREFALEGILTDGQLRVLAMFDKPDPLDGPYFEETIYVTPSREPAETQREIIRTTEVGGAGARAHARPGPRRDARESARRLDARSGGAADRRLVRARASRARRTDSAPCGGRRRLIGRDAAGSSGRHDDPDSARRDLRCDEGLEQRASTPGIEDVIITAKQGQKLVPLPEGAAIWDSSSRAAKSPERVERALRDSACDNCDLRSRPRCRCSNPSTSAERNRAATRRLRRRSNLPSA